MGNITYHPVLEILMNNDNIIISAILESYLSFPQFVIRTPLVPRLSDTPIIMCERGYTHLIHLILLVHYLCKI
jgi:hypothetical protein